MTAARVPHGHVTAACTGTGTPDELHGNTPGWGALAFNAAGVTLVPGQTATYHVWEPVPAGAVPTGHVYVNCYFGPNVGGPADGYPLAMANARVVGATGGTSTTRPTSAPPTSAPSAAASTSAAAGAGSTAAAIPTSATSSSASGATKHVASKNLASTGASVLWPAIAGLVLLGAGLAAMLLARHRKATS